jgi:hypothetical protein
LKVQFAGLLATFDVGPAELEPAITRAEDNLYLYSDGAYELRGAEDSFFS